jgi:hypothetical protein
LRVARWLLNETRMNPKYIVLVRKEVFPRTISKLHGPFEAESAAQEYRKRQLTNATTLAVVMELVQP